MIPLLLQYDDYVIARDVTFCSYTHKPPVIQPGYLSAVICRLTLKNRTIVAVS